MPTEIQFEDLRPDESNEARRLIEACFDQHVRYTCTEEGHGEFSRASQLMLYACPINHFNLVAKEAGRIVGIINVRDACHICLFFVAPTHLKRGIGRALFERAVERCLEEDPGLKLMGVHSSLFAVPFYERLGFERIGTERSVNGITFQEMKLALWRRPKLVSSTELIEH